LLKKFFIHRTKSKENLLFSSGVSVLFNIVVSGRRLSTTSLHDFTKMIELHTSRLLLRQWKKTDLPDFAEMNSNPRVMKYFPNLLTLEESIILVEKFSNRISERGWGLWALEEKSSNKFIGFTGLHEVSKDLPFGPTTEIGWRLSDKFWGNGYATEAAGKVLQFAFTELKLKEVVSFTSVINVKSEAVMKRLNMINTQSNFLHPQVPDNHPLKEHVLYKINKNQYLQNAV
jgi:RimJ/RimL family protein N-acetyltransferase